MDFVDGGGGVGVVEEMEVEVVDVGIVVVVVVVGGNKDCVNKNGIRCVTSVV